MFRLSGSSLHSSFWWDTCERAVLSLCARAPTPSRCACSLLSQKWKWGLTETRGARHRNSCQMRVHLENHRVEKGPVGQLPALLTAHPACPLEFPLNWFNISLVFPLMNELNKSLDMSAFCFCMTVKLLPFLKLSFSYSTAEQIITETFKEQLGRDIMVNFITTWALLECTYHYFKTWIQFITLKP